MSESTTGTLFSKKVSSISSPAVNYSASYSAVRASTSSAAVSITISLSAWLNTSASSLKRGIKLTARIRIDSGAWQNILIKASENIWSGTDRHTASGTITISSQKDTCEIELYVTRSGSTYGGIAGSLGTETNPMRYTVTLPGYHEGPKPPTPTPDPPESAKLVFVQTKNGLKQVKAFYVKIKQWKQAKVHVKLRNNWKAL